MSDVPIPFEVIHPDEAKYMQWLFCLGYRLVGPASDFTVRETPLPSKRKRRPKYNSTIAWIRRLPDTEVVRGIAEKGKEA